MVQYNFLGVPCMFCTSEFLHHVDDCFQKLAQRASISSTLFMRTTQKRHKEVVKSIWVRYAPFHPFIISFLIFLELTRRPRPHIQGSLRGVLFYDR